MAPIILISAVLLAALIAIIVVKVQMDNFNDSLDSSEMEARSNWYRLSSCHHCGKEYKGMSEDNCPHCGAPRQ